VGLTSEGERTAAIGPNRVLANARFVDLVAEITARFPAEQPAVEVLAALDVCDGEPDVAESGRHDHAFGFSSHGRQAATARDS
jgi:hypothetical protein